MEQKIKALLSRIVHPESGRNIVESGMVSISTPAKAA